MLKKMWSHLMKRGIMITPPPMIDIPKDIQRPETHSCPRCGAGISRMWLYRGGIVGRGPDAVVRAQIRCHQCRKQHSLQGATPYERGVVLILLGHPRKRPGERMQLFRTGALA